MSAHEQRLLAAGIDPQTARRDAWADSLQWLNNREQYANSAEYARGEGPQEQARYEDRRG